MPEIKHDVGKTYFSDNWERNFNIANLKLERLKLS